MKIKNNEIIIPKFIKIPCHKCEEIVRSYFKKLTSDSEGGLSVEYKTRYSFKEENDYINRPLCKGCFQLNNIKK